MMAAVDNKTLQAEADNIRKAIQELARKLPTLARWEAARANGSAGLAAMEIRHDLEDALKSVRKLEEAEE